MNTHDLKALLKYDPDTGYIYWIAKGKGRIKKKPAGTMTSNGYIGICINGKRIFAHRIAWQLHYGSMPSDQIDHINGNTKDNRIINLREATNAQNGKNLKLFKSNTSGIKGVSLCKATKKWRATIKVGFKMICLGRYDKIENAAKARKDAEVKYFGEWNRT